MRNKRHTECPLKKIEGMSRILPYTLKYTTTYKNRYFRFLDFNQIFSVNDTIIKKN